MRVSSRVNKGKDSRVKLEDEQAAAAQPPPPPPPQKKAPRKLKSAVPVAPPVPVPADNQVPMPAIVQRSLDLDIPISADFKYSKDFGEWNNKFWLDNFYTPDDYTTREYMAVTDRLNDILPANFRLIEGQKEAFGVANLELKPEFVKPAKKVPLLSKLQNGEYEIASSKSDKNIAATIKFFKNSLPGFQHFKDSDDISWVITHHRQLVVEILKFYAAKPTTSIATIKSRFNAITRIIRIAYETKNYQLYDKYSALVLFLGTQFEQDEHNNELSELELQKFIPFNIVLDTQKDLQQQFATIRNKNTIKAYESNQNLLLVSLYSLIPPLRREIFSLKFSNTVQAKDDWIVIKPDEVLMDLNEEKKRHDSILFNLTNDAPELAKILRESYELYPRTYLFTPSKKYPDVSIPASVSTLETRLSKIFLFTGKRVSVNSFRSSYVSYMNSEAIRKGKQLTVNDKEKIAYRMRTSRKYLDEAYLKIFPIAQDYRAPSIKEEPKDDAVSQQINETTPYQKQLSRNQKYYEENKQKVLTKQKEYKDSIPKQDKNRAKILYYLNSDPNYHQKMRDSTKQKYNFKQEASGRWV